ncbi:sigma-70 region 4 domain-containing protein [Stenotrophomonas sp. SAU14A_NAIMI4_8]|uniref:sigma-70 region 4 domain-containing protein n=1 Tax=Stenotrophomonas sp. SAU14A_NAIMI4_8 TaxID=2072409 RepID=UPI000D541937|nr:sigma-70 region 4 domain-containing protein [Stenotrophomonas sp. SAU14A_NAIMI4_8]AWH34562.1 transcriptional regulator [Stenotrophomonas sp. SAU14A_NAIMI4_8]
MDTPNAHALRPASERIWQSFLAALAQLPADARAVLLLHDVLGADVDDIVPLLGLSAAACHQRLLQARAHLHQPPNAVEPPTP